MHKSLQLSQNKDVEDFEYRNRFIYLSLYVLLIFYLYVRIRWLTNISKRSNYWFSGYYKYSLTDKRKHRCLRPFYKILGYHASNVSSKV